jgi:hypothetical protein
MISIEDKFSDWSEMDLKIVHEDEDNNLLSSSIGVIRYTYYYWTTD